MTKIQSSLIQQHFPFRTEGDQMAVPCPCSFPLKRNHHLWGGDAVSHHSLDHIFFLHLKEYWIQSNTGWPRNFTSILHTNLVHHLHQVPYLSLMQSWVQNPRKSSNRVTKMIMTNRIFRDGRVIRKTYFRGTD